MRSDASRLWGALLVTLALRLLVFPVNEHLYGDAVSRTEMAEAWARAPHVITSFVDGAAQYGPLHLYLIGTVLPIVDRNDASRLISLVFGVLTVIPLFALTRHYFATPSAWWACLAFACWSLHLQASTTGGSEALALFLMWVAFAWFARGLYRPHWFPFSTAGVALTLASATRYDAWMYIPLLAVVPFFQWPDRRRAGKFVAIFLATALPFPILWMWGNYAATGDALYPLTYIDAFHRQWVEDSTTGGLGWWLRLQGLGFWPTIAVVTLSPGVAILGAIGMASAWRIRPASRWLILAAVVPTLYYTFRTAVRLDFVPLGRFTVVQVSLLLPFVTTGWAWLLATRGRLVAVRVAQASALLAVLVPAGLGLLTRHNDSRLATVLKPISPIATNPRWVMRAADTIRATVVDADRSVALDEDPTYEDLQVGFYARLDPSRTLWVRHGPSDTLMGRLARMRPDTLVVFANGTLLRAPWSHLAGDHLTIDGLTYRARPVQSALGPVRIFDRQ